MDYIFQLLTTLLALNGNQVMELDYQTQLGRDTHTELAGYRSIEPYQNVNQIRNYAILCALLGWDATAVMPQTPQLHFLRHFGEQYSVAQASANQIKFLEYYVDNWNTNWLAGQVEANILKRLAIQSSTKAPVFLEKLQANSNNLTNTHWYHWYLLNENRRKEDATKYAQEFSIDTSPGITTKYPLAHQLSAKIQIVWPRLVRTDTYTYSFSQNIWANSIIPSPNLQILIPNDWKAPTTSTYQRKWQTGPSWQITYSRQDDWVYKTATFIKRNSHIEGQIQDNNFKEAIVEELTAPKGFVNITPTYIIVNR